MHSGLRGLTYIAKNIGHDMNSGALSAHLHDVYDEEALHDYLEAFSDTLAEVEQVLPRLAENPAQQEHINALFRSLHTIKSNAAMCQLDLIVALAHPLEDVMAAVRAGTFRFNGRLGELFLLIMDRIRVTVDSLLANKPIEPLRLQEIVVALQELATAHPLQMETRVQRLFYIITGEAPATTGSPTEGRTRNSSNATPKQLEDLKFFKLLSQSVEHRTPFWEGRTERLQNLAFQTNVLAGQIIDPVQLEAAVYVHDIGMAFMSETIWHKQGKLNDLELNELQSHPLFSAGLLERMPGWDEARLIVLQHHERPDGTGYPARLKNGQIVPGALLLSILDAFEAMTHERVDRQHKRSVLRAITELNACDTQFAPEWVKPFNIVVRKLLETVTD